MTTEYRNAFEAVVDLRDRLVAAVTAVLGLTRAEAEDVVSSVVVRVLERGLAPTRGASWFAYLRAAVLNEGRDQAQQRSSEADREVRVFLRAGHHIAVDAVAVTTALLDALSDLAVLSPDERRVFLMHAVHGLTFREIAARTGLPEGGVRSRHRQAVAKLAGCQEVRERDPAYLPVLAILRPWAERTGRLPADAGVFSSPIAACVAAFAVVITTGMPPSVGRLRWGDPSLPRARDNVQAAVTTGHRKAEGAKPTVHDGVVAPKLPGSQPERVKSFSASSVQGCAIELVCVEPAASSASRGQAGDAITIAPIGYTIRQRVTPVCWALPKIDMLACEPGQRDSYAARLPQGREPPRDSAIASSSNHIPSEIEKRT